MVVHLCENGCGLDGIYHSKWSKRWLCSSNPSKCPSIKSKIALSKISSKVPFSTESCKNCGTFNAIKFSKWSTGKFCSVKCSRSFSSKNSGTQRNAKISTSLKEHYKYATSTKVIPISLKTLAPLQNCTHGCGQKAGFYQKNGKWACGSHRMQCPVYRTRSSQIAKSHRLGGYRERSVKGKSGYYKGIWCDSSWELAWIVFHSEHNTDFRRNTDKFTYIFEGVERTYLPDFKVGKYWVEIKGYSTEQWESKVRQFPFPDKLIVLFGEDMSEIFRYVVDRYGKNFTCLYDQESP